MECDRNIEWNFDTLGSVLMQIRNEILDHNSQMQKMQTRMDLQEEKLTKLENEVQQLKVTLESESKKRETLMNKIEQKAMDNGIVLKGFNYDFNEENVIENFTKAIKSNYPLSNIYKFQMKITKEGKVKPVYFLNIMFTCKSDKKKAISYVVENGFFKAEELDENCPPEELESNIFIENALTNTNLKIKKTIMKARSKMEKDDLLIKMRGNFYHAKFKNQQGWKMITDTDEANKILDQATKGIQFKRNRQSPQDPTTTPASKKKNK